MSYSFFKNGANVALDLGNNNTLLNDAGNNFLSQPSFIVLNNIDKSIRAVGKDAYEMWGKTNEGFKVIKPLKGGIIADYEAVSKMLKTLVQQAHPRRTLFRRFDQLVCGIPYSTTEVEKRALRDALEQFGARKTFLISEPLAAAIGMNLNVQEPDGKLIVDIGGGITEIALISLSGIVNYRSLEIAGDSFDEEIQNYCKQMYHISIGIQQAEQLKIKTGAACNLESDGPEPVFVVGKDCTTGIPRNVEIGHAEIADVLNNSLKRIENALLEMLDECPPELSGDIYANGIYVTGGSSLLRGLKKRLAAKLNTLVHQDPNGLLSVSKGISKIIASPTSYKALLFK